MIGWLKGPVGLAIVGLLLLLLVLVFPAFTGRASERVGGSPWMSLGVGAGVLLVTPLAIVFTFVIGLLVGGWWIALLLLPLNLTVVVLGYLWAAVTAGTRVLVVLNQPMRHLGWALLAGLIVLGVLGLIPLAGGIIAFLAVCAGLGGLEIAASDAYRAETRIDCPTRSPEGRPGNDARGR